MAVKLLLVLSLAVVAVSSAGILETLLSWDFHDTEGRSSTPQPQCIYQTNGYLCCVNITSSFSSSIEPRPACVNINQKNNNVTLNLSYGDNPVHNATIKIDDAANKPTCMNLHGNINVNIIQLCAKFTTVTRQDAGHIGCLVIEPFLIGSPEDTYSMGCFKFDGGVKLVETPTTIEATTNLSTKDASTQDDDDDDESINTDELFAVVSESAEQGLALFSRWLGLKLNDKINSTNNNDVPNKNHDIQKNITTSRSGRGMILDNNPIHEDKSDERFKQLLSAQDNILKESEMIGNSDGKKTTFVYAQIPDNTNIQKNILSIPRESRRGGRAYNIHQHINEI